ncbi:WD40-repeat-containing domain protein [Thamnocephalis sphaerospora]|uniref:Elongator complex protein 2 n=1 Tax=Thamnocephalis sphaerospora TaxID=78915 RepID=A0A4P9XYY6_9FUNG|nr:WD40-repeat-containing domain protein [Thamnocephalis sphaerospora]|eukprot:RKP10931.1 WD40-repeat-containing domain protein [Thamnocephalis sphaerospora]
MTAVHVAPSLIAVGCNQLPGTVAWSPDGLVAYAADQSVALYRLPPTVDAGSNTSPNPAGAGVFTTLHGHKGRVNAVRFIVRDQQTVAIISAAADNTVRVWRRVDSTSDKEWQCTDTLKGHSAAVNSVALLSMGDTDLLATAASDGSICIWSLPLSADPATLLQTIDLGGRDSTALALEQLPGTSIPVLVSASTDMRISLYTQRSGQFVRMLQLQGHTDWIRALQFVRLPASPTAACKTEDQGTGELMLASASQDRYIRLWRLTALSSDIGAGSEKQPPAALATPEDSEAVAMESLLDTLQKTALEGDGAQLSTQAFLFEATSADSDSTRWRFSVMLDAVLQGHDDWVYSLCWHPPMLKQDGGYEQPLRLLSASADKSAIIWAPDETTGIWLPESRVGEIAGTSLGLYGALFSADGSSILAHGHHGAFHLWARVSEDDDTIARWEPRVCVSGHFSSVQGLTWHPEGRFLVSVSLDQTARLYAPWIQHEMEQTSWHEIARPQVHGYDMQCVSFIDHFRYASGADEKVVRIFDAPAAFVRTLASLTGDMELLKDAESRPAAANLPPLGLSNKAIAQEHVDGNGAAADEDAMDGAETEEVIEASHGQSYALPRGPRSFGATDAQQPPFDEQLQQLTLWPETEKLYGHGFEIIAVASSRDGRYLATACKAASPEHAILRIFDTQTWKELPSKLAAHTLTVTKARFAHNDRWLLTVSRDRSWALYKRGESEHEPFTLAAKMVKAHARIIWDASWSPDDLLFATGSRDKTVKIWKQVVDSAQPDAWSCAATIKCKESVTAIDFAPLCAAGYCLAVGHEDGHIAFYRAGESAADWALLGQVPASLAHASTVNGLVWRCPPQEGHGSGAASSGYQLATCGQDHSLRLLDVSFA